MFVRASIFVLAIAASVIASPGGTRRTGSCSTGELQCCKQITSANNAPADILSALGPGDVVGALGLDCDPITAVGTGSGAACTAQTVCCTRTQDVSNQLIGVDCSSANLNL